MANKYTNFTSPRGRARYPYLVRPDTQFDDDGVYKVDLVVPGEEAQEFITQIKREMQSYLDSLDDDVDPGTINLPFEEQDDGAVWFRCKCDAKIETKDGQTFNNEPALFDSMGNAVDVNNVGGGSLIRTAGYFYTWGPVGNVGSGLTLRLSAVQIIELEEWQPEAEDYGFGREDGSFGTTEETGGTPDESSDPAEEDFDF